MFSRRTVNFQKVEHWKLEMRRDFALKGKRLTSLRHVITPLACATLRGTHSQALISSIIPDIPELKGKT